MFTSLLSRIKPALLLSLLCLLPSAAHAQPWAGIIQTPRAVDWSNAGVIGGIPTRNTQCGATIAPLGVDLGSGTMTSAGTAITKTSGPAWTSAAVGKFIRINYASGGINMTNGSPNGVWVEGAQFQTGTGWNGATMIIGGDTFTVDHVVDATHIVFTVGWPSGTQEWGFGGGGSAQVTAFTDPTHLTLNSSANTGVSYSLGAAPPTAINSAIAACPSGQFVSLAPGTFYLAAGIDWGTTSNVTVRGAGGDSTFIIFSGTASCNGLNSVICIAGSNSSPGSEQNVVNWTAGYSQGATSITVASAPNMTAGSTYVILDQLDESTDNAGIFNCLVTGVCSNDGSGGFARTDGPCNGGMCNRSQQEMILVTACSPSCPNATPTVLTLARGLYMPNWSSGQQPQAWWANSFLTGDGLENVSIDATSSNSNESIVAMNANNCWLKGVRSLYANRNHVWLYESSHCSVVDSYFYQNISHASVSYGMEVSPGSSDNLIQNNIWQQVTDSTPNNNGGASANVVGYNFSAVTSYGGPNWMQANEYQHASGGDYWLYEGNVGQGLTADNVHGTHYYGSSFREYLAGWFTQPISLCGPTPGVCSQTDAIQLYAASRGFNIIGDILGQPGYHNTYDCQAPNVCTNGNNAIYVLGYTGNGGGVDASITGFCINHACGSKTDADSLTSATLMRWGNYDTVTSTVRFVSGEVPTAASSPFTNSLPASHTLPPSFYLPSKPSWWTSMPYPAIGPDVLSGGVGHCVGGSFPGAWALSAANCTGGSFTADLGAHVNPNPAMACYFNIMGGKADGSGSPLSFNANTCYNSLPFVATPTFNPAAGTYPVTQSVTLASATSGATICYTTDNSTPTTNGAGSCTHGTTYTVPISIAVTTTIKAIGTKSAFSDSTIATGLFTITPLVVSAPTFTPIAGNYAAPQTITLSTITAGAAICFTVDGSTPTTNGNGTCTHGTTYTVPVTVSTTQTIKAIGTKSTYTDSGISSALYTIAIDTPTFSPVAGTYAVAQSVAISTVAGGTTICSTTDNSTPTADGAGTCTHGSTYTGAITVSTTQTVKAIGSKAGNSDSAVGTAVYTITAATVATPTFNPAGGSYSTTISVTLSSATGGATICYTIDNSTPTTNGAGVCTHGTTYTVPISITVSTALKATASKAGSSDSVVTLANFNVYRLGHGRKKTHFILLSYPYYSYKGREKL